MNNNIYFWKRALETQIKSSCKKSLPVSPGEALVADISALFLGHTGRQRLGDIHQLPLLDPDCRPQTITFPGTDEPLQLRSHFLPMCTPSAVYIRTHVRVTPWRHSDVRTHAFPQIAL